MNLTKQNLVALVLGLVFLNYSFADNRTEDYFKYREGILLKYKTSPPSDQELSNYIRELKNKIVEIIGSVNVSGFEDFLKQAYFTLDPEFDGQVFEDRIDGLSMFSKDSKKGLFATTRGLLDNFLSRHSKLPKEYKRLFQDQSFYSYAFWPNFTKFAEIPVGSRFQNITGFLMLKAQDIGGWPPNTIVVALEKGEQILVLQDEIDGSLPVSLEICNSFWNSNHSQKKNKSKQIKSEEHLFKEQVECYRKNTPKQTSFGKVIDYATTMINRVR